MLCGPQLERVYLTVLEDILQSNFAKLDLVIMSKNFECQSLQPQPGLVKSILNSQSRRSFIYDLYLRLDRRMKPQNYPLDREDASEALSGVDRIETDLIVNENGARLPDKSIADICARNLDVLINFTGHRLSGDILRAARHGVWSYHVGDSDAYSGGPPLFWELYEGSTLSGVELHAESSQGSRVLCKSFFNTQATISVSANRFAPCWGSSEMVIRKLNQLHRSVQGSGSDKVTGSPETSNTRGTPTNLEMVRWLAPVFLKKAVRFPFRQRSVQHWRIGIRRNAEPLYTSLNSSLEGFQWIEAPKGHFWADPFGFEHEGKPWIFFEDYSYQQKLAWLACSEIRDDGTLSPPIECLNVPGRHLSYPYIFRDGREIFLIPESYDSGSVDLYRCESFPDRWTRVANLFRGKFVDTSVWQDQGLWWLMTTNVDPNPRTPCLFLFYSDSLTGKWQFHPANPVSTDIRNNRGAGRIFQANGKCIRPSQSCSPLYGYSFSLNEIVELSRDRYSERLLRTITPEYWQGLCAVHTYNRVGGIELIDGASMLPLKSVAP